VSLRRTPMPPSRLAIRGASRGRRCARLCPRSGVGRGRGEGPFGQVPNPSSAGPSIRRTVGSRAGGVLSIRFSADTPPGLPPRLVPRVDTTIGGARSLRGPGEDHVGTGPGLVRRRLRTLESVQASLGRIGKGELTSERHGDERSESGVLACPVPWRVGHTARHGGAPDYALPRRHVCSVRATDPVGRPAQERDAFQGNPAAWQGRATRCLSVRSWQGPIGKTTWRAIRSPSRGRARAPF